jgi:hypothetical protein
MDDPGFNSQKGIEVFVLHNVKTRSGAYPVSYSVSLGGCFPEGKAAGVCS